MFRAEAATALDPKARDASCVSGLAVVDRIVVRRQDWFILTARIAGENSPVTIVGRADSSALFPGSRLQFEGRVVNNPKYGRQIEAHRVFDVQAPADEASLVKAYATLPGIGPAKAAKLIAEAGGPERAATMIADSPEDILTLPTALKLPAAQRAEIERQLVEARDEMRAKSVLFKLGFGPGSFKTALEWAGDATRLLKIAGERPYSLREVRGISFSRLDDGLIKAKHAAVDSPARAQAIIEAAFQSAADMRGHTALTRPMVTGAVDGLKLSRPLPPDDLNAALRKALGSGKLVSLSTLPDPLSDGAALVASDEWHRAETRVADAIGRLIDRWAQSPSVAPDEPMPALSDTGLDATQRAAIDMLWRAPIGVLTGGAGTGKTRLIKALIDAIGRHDVLLVAPTGKAARRVSEMTGVDASTIHRADSALDKQAEAAGIGGRYGPHTIIIDEGSMVSSDVFEMLARHILNPCCNVRRLIIAGDDGQLPPVGPGAPMRDILACERVVVARLTRTYRQFNGADSHLIAGAGAVSAGEWPASPAGALMGPRIGQHSDFGTMMVKGSEVNAAMIAQAALDVYWRIVEERGAGEKDIVMLSGQRTGNAGVNALNAALRARWRKMSPGSAGAREGLESDDLVAGDRVVWVKNHYDAGAMNGDIGTVAAVETEPARRIVVALDSGDTVSATTREHFLSLRLAYALSVHRSQGSEWPFVVAVASVDHFALLSRRLLYVALTRARNLCVLATAPKALGMALGRESPGGERRLTALPTLLERVLSARAAQ